MTCIMDEIHVESIVLLFAVFTPARGPASEDNERFAPEVVVISQVDCYRLSTDETSPCLAGR